MGEKAMPPQEDMDTGSSEDDSVAINDDGAEDDEEIDDVASEEFQAINTQLDALNFALDNIEQKNEDIHAQLLQLLQSNREMRKQIQELNNSESVDPKS